MKTTTPNPKIETAIPQPILSSPQPKTGVAVGDWSAERLAERATVITPQLRALLTEAGHGDGGLND